MSFLVVELLTTVMESVVLTKTTSLLVTPRFLSHQKTSTVVVSFLDYDDVHALTSADRKWYLWRYDPAKRRLFCRIWRHTVSLQQSTGWVLAALPFRDTIWFLRFMEFFRHGSTISKALRLAKRRVKARPLTDWHVQVIRHDAEVLAHWKHALSFALQRNLLERQLPPVVPIRKKASAVCCIL